MNQQTPSQLRHRLDALPRVALAATPTPLHELPRLSERLGVRVLVKRDDLTGLAFGGNKIRQLEFFVGEARAAGADTFVAGGSFAQSNHARACAAAARAAGLAPIVLVRPGAAPGVDDANGNALLTHYLAEEVRVVDALADVPRGDRLGEVAARRASFETVVAELRGQGRRPYALVGSSTALGVMGYVAATLELEEQRVGQGLEFSTAFVSSLGVTHAGLECGRRALGAPWSVVGVAYQPTQGRGAGWVRELMDGAAELLGLRLDTEDVVSDDRAAGEAYGTPTAASREALGLAARSDALLLDPVYTAKGFAGLIQWIREGRVPQGDTVVFVHTGGLPALFAYGDELRAVGSADVA